ncbi:MAG: amino acid permease [Rhodothermales bacterium]|nr:amino acid permease [Rhodothermales bacterium]
MQLTLLGVGAIIGTGIFVLTGTAAAGGSGHLGAGPALVVSFGLTAIACSLAALCYAEFASMMPVAGSAYAYAYASFGELVAWIIGWDLILEYAVGNVAVAIGWSGYFQGLLSGFGLHLPEWLRMDPMTAASQAPEVLAIAPRVLGLPVVINLPAILVVLGVTLLLCVGITESARANAVFVVIKLVLIALFLIVGLKHVDPANWKPFAPNGWNGILTGASLIFFAYIGFDAVSTTAEEARNPQRDLPRGIIGSLVVCTILYMVVTVVLTGMVPAVSLANAEPVASALRTVGADGAAALISAGAVVSMISVLLVMQLGQTRIFYAMGRDGLLPKRFSSVHPRFHTPIVPTIVVGLVVALVAGLIDISAAAELTNIGTLFAFILVAGGVWWLRAHEPDRSRAFRVPLMPWIAIAAIASCFYLMLGLPATTWIRFGVWLAIGLVIYAVYSRRHSVLAQRHAADVGTGGASS